MENSQLKEQLEREKRRYAELKVDMESSDSEARKTGATVRDEQLKYTEALKILLKDIALADYDKARKAVLEGKQRLGHPSYERISVNRIEEYWINGSAYMDLERKEQIATRREELYTKQKNEDRKKRAKVAKGKKLSQDHTSGFAKPPDKNDHSDEYLADVAVLDLNLAQVKAEKKELLNERGNLDREKILLNRELKRITDEDQAKFAWYRPGGAEIIVLNERYALLGLLGKGGFSEVFKAYDLVCCEMVACKIHQLQVGIYLIVLANFLSPILPFIFPFVSLRS